MPNPDSFEIKHKISGLNKIASGGLLFLTGTITATAFKFLMGIVIIRSMAPGEFGLVSLANTVVTVGIIISLLGIGNGLPQLISKYHNQTGATAEASFTNAAVILVILSSLILAVLFYALSFPISRMIAKPELEPALRCFSLMMPPVALMSVFTAIFRGREHTLPKIIFQDVALNLSRVLVFSAILFIGSGYFAVIRGYVFTAWGVFIFYLVYWVKKTSPQKHLSLNISTAGKILSTSLPLMGVVLIDNLTAWSGTLSLGWLSTFGEVGKYNAPQRLAAILNMPLSALVFVYLPVATKTYIQYAIVELKALYQTVCKWVFIITMPFALFFLLDAKFVVTLLFGTAYGDSASVLRILTVGYMINTIPGPNNMTLISMGKSGAVLTGTLLACLTAIGFFIFWIPSYGALGAAGGMVAARCVSNLFAGVVLYAKTRVQPFSPEYGRILFVSLPTGGLLYGGRLLLSPENVISHLFFLLFSITMMFIAFFIIRGITKQDIGFVRTIEMRIRGNAGFSDWLCSHM